MTKNKPLPKNHPLHHASKEIIAAVDFYQKMLEHHLGDFASFDACWRGFLQKIDRVWNKTQAAMAGYPLWKKLENEVVGLRNDDSLLRYLRHARNADEHSIQAVASEWNSELRISQIKSTESQLAWNGWDRPLLPVRNRRVTFDPPREHLGQNLQNKLKKGIAEPIVVADLALHFYKNVPDRCIAEVLEPAARQERQGGVEKSLN